MTSQPPSRTHFALLLLWLPLLVGLQSIPGTGALRTLMLLAGISHVVWCRQRIGGAISLPRASAEGWLLFALSVWIVIPTLFISASPGESFSLYLREWCKLLLMAGIGIAIARLYVVNWQWLTTAMFAGAFLHVASTLGFQAISLARGQGVIIGNSLLGNYGYAAPFTTAAFAWLLADIVSRQWHRRPLFPWPIGVTIILSLAALAAEAFLNAKSSHVMIVLLVLTVTLATFMNRRSRRNVGLLLTAAFLIATVAGVLFIGSGRWHGASESIRLAWKGPIDTETLTGSTDPQARVNRLDPSFYPRMVWARAGLEGIADHPLGMGYGANAFGRYVQERFAIPGAISSHSGWIDFALANGIIGLLLFLALAISLIRRGLLSFLAGNPAGAALALLVLHFVCRGLLDGILTGSRLTGFALVAGGLWAICRAEKNAPRPD